MLSVGAVEHAVRSLAADFAKETGHQVIFTIASPAVVMQKIKDNEIHDAVIVSEPAMDQLDRDGIVNPESRVRLANTGLGVAVRDGAPVPDLSTAGGVQTGAAGGEVDRLRRPGAAQSERREGGKNPRQGRHPRHAQAEDADRARAGGKPGADRQGHVEMGLYNVSEIPEGKGLKLAGPVPAPLQISTTYEGALMSDGAVPEAARAFIRFLAEPEARAKWLAAKLEPLADH